MTLKKGFFLVKMNFLARKKINFIYVILYFLGSVFLVGASSFGSSLMWGVDNYINTAQETVEYRQFQVYCERDNANKLAEFLKGRAKIAGYDEEEKTYLVELKDYKEKYAVAETIEEQGIGTSIIDTRVEASLKILQNLRKGSIGCFLVTIFGVLTIMNINISQMISERNYEIGIAYAVGYSINQIMIQFWVEAALLMTVGLCMAYGVVFSAEPYIANAVPDFINYEGIGLWQPGGYFQVGAIVCGSILVVLCLQMHNIRKKLSRISPMDLIR